MKSVLRAALLASISFAPAFAADTAKAPDPKPAKQEASSDKPAKEKLICTREAEVGSIIARKVCRTPEQVEADRRAAQAVNDDRLRQGRADLPPGR